MRLLSYLANWNQIVIGQYNNLVNEIFHFDGSRANKKPTCDLEKKKEILRLVPEYSNRFKLCVWREDFRGAVLIVMFDLPLRLDNRRAEHVEPHVKSSSIKKS